MSVPGLVKKRKAPYSEQNPERAKKGKSMSKKKLERPTSQDKYGGTGFPTNPNYKGKGKSSSGKPVTKGAGSKSKPHLMKGWTVDKATGKRTRIK